MLFNSVEFIFVFLPITLTTYYVCLKLTRNVLAAQATIIGASLAFYSYWDARYIWLILGSATVNFLLGLGITAAGRYRRAMLAIGVVANLGLLFYFKYFAFAWNQLGRLLDNPTIHTAPGTLPLAISFFTFHQISFLVDVYKGITSSNNPLRYGVFVTFFPTLIAGPIVYFREFDPQLPNVSGTKSDSLARGITFFTFGLFKKVVLADSIALWANPVFTLAAQGRSPTFFEAWFAALAYTMQLYFDFSGYSDMAIGLASMLGMRIPYNFNSPYKAQSLIDFWRRWHMMLSRFLRDYLYIPLGGNRRGEPRRYINIFITMVLGGIWHGAGWTYVLWGAWHGCWLMLNHVTRSLRPHSGFLPYIPRRVSAVGSWAVTFFLVCIGWVIFRASSVSSAVRVLTSMFGLHGIAMPTGCDVWAGGWGRALVSRIGGRCADAAFTSGFYWSPDGWLFGPLSGAVIFLGLLMIISILAPNTQELIDGPRGQWSEPLPEQAVPRATLWGPTFRWAASMALLFFLSCMFLNRVTQFIYFQF